MIAVLDVDAIPTPPDWILQGGAAGLLAIVVIMILTGRLVPLRFYRQLQEDRDLWRATAEKSLGQTETLLPAARIATEVTRALAGATGVHSTAQEGDDAV